MKPELRQRMAELGRDLSPGMLGGTNALFAELQQGIDPKTKVTRDIAYGPDERNLLDIFVQPGTSGAPVLVYLHGGGFVMGNKHTDGSPFYSNVGDMAARAGMVGAVITYRLAPANRFPSGPEDLAAALTWLRANVGEYGGDPDRIVLCGQSAGAAHVAGYVAHRRFHVADGGGIRAAAMFSGIYDTLSCEANDFHKAYYGEDRAAWGPASCMAGLLNADIPLLFTVAEMDPQDFQKQAALLVGAWGVAHAAYPEMHLLAGHNHLSPALSMGTDEREVERMLTGFVRRVCQ